MARTHSSRGSRRRFGNRKTCSTRRTGSACSKTWITSDKADRAIGTTTSGLFKSLRNAVQERGESGRDMGEAGAAVRLLVPRIDYEIWSSDHVSFANAGIPSIMTCSDHNNYPHYHRTTDLPEHLNMDAGFHTISMHVRALIERMETDLMDYLSSDVVDEFA